MKGLYIAPPHGELIAKGEKTAIAKVDFEPGTVRDLRGEWTLVSGKLAYGTVQVGEPEKIDLSEFSEREKEHRVSRKERRKWWPGRREFWLYPLRCSPFPKMLPVETPAGVQTVMSKVPFGGDGWKQVVGIPVFVGRKVKSEKVLAPKGKRKGEKVYTRWNDVNRALRGIKPRISLEQANLIASWADAMERAEDSPENPWGAAIAQFYKLYRPDDGKGWIKIGEKELVIVPFEDSDFKEGTFVPPKAAQVNARRVLRWRSEHPGEIKGMTRVGWTRANQLASGKPVSLDVVKRMAQFARHLPNYEKAKRKPEAKSKPWKIAAIVAVLGWGGEEGIAWAKRVSEREGKKAGRRVIIKGRQVFIKGLLAHNPEIAIKENELTLSDVLRYERKLLDKNDISFKFLISSEGG